MVTSVLMQKNDDILITPSFNSTDDYIIERSQNAISAIPSAFTPLRIIITTENSSKISFKVIYFINENGKLIHQNPQKGIKIYAGKYTNKITRIEVKVNRFKSSEISEKIHSIVEMLNKVEKDQALKSIQKNVSMIREMLTTGQYDIEQKLKELVKNEKR